MIGGVSYSLFHSTIMPMLAACLALDMSVLPARMIEGAEKTHWSEQVMVMDKFQQITNAATITGCYALGYSTGYIAEQVAVGILTGGTVKVAAVMTKGGAVMATQLAARRVLPVAARLQFVKKWAASVAISIEMKVAVERGLIIAAETPLSLAVKDSAAEVIERGMKRATFERTAFSNSKVLDEVIAALNIKKLILTPGREGQFWYKFALFFEVMGDKATAPASKGWVKAYNRLLKFNGDILEDDRAADLVTLFKAETSANGKNALKKTLEEFSALPSGTAKPLMYVREIETIQTTMYRYSNYVPNSVNGIPKLGVHPDIGWYVSFDKVTSANEAKFKLLLPENSTAAYRLEFETVLVKDKAYVPYGNQNASEVLEPLTRDFPDQPGVVGAGGGGTQMLAKDVEIQLKEVWNISTNPPQRIFPPNP